MYGKRIRESNPTKAPIGHSLKRGNGRSRKKKKRANPNPISFIIINDLTYRYNVDSVVFSSVRKEEGRILYIEGEEEKKKKKTERRETKEARRGRHPAGDPSPKYNAELAHQL